VSHKIVERSWKSSGRDKQGFGFKSCSDTSLFSYASCHQIYRISV